MNNRKTQFKEESLYGSSGRPQASNIHQDILQNCYFLAPIGALAEQQPDRIRDAIRFDPNTGDFTVRLYRPPNAGERQAGQSDPVETFITVSQDDLRRNIRREGGSTVDNNRDRTGALWPAVLEAGFAELYGRDSRGRVNMENAYDLIADATRGGSLSDGMYALTGDAGRNIQIPMPDSRPRKNHGPDYVSRPEPPAFQAIAPGDMLSLQEAHTRVEQALAAGRPVSLATQGREVNDGLQESHAYMVMGISRHAATGDTLLRLRNTYGDNTKTKEGNHHIGGDWKDTDPEIIISLNDIVRKGSFGEFNIGPAPRVQTQAPQSQSQPVAPATEPSTSAQPATIPLLSDPAHPAHAMYAQALHGIAASAQLSGGRFPIEQQRLIAANLVAGMVSLPQSRMHGALTLEKLDRIDAVTLSSDGSRVIEIEGKPGALAHFRFRLPLEQAHSGSIEAASQQAFDGLQQQKAQELARQAERERAPQPQPEGPAR